MRFPFRHLASVAAAALVGMCLVPVTRLHAQRVVPARADWLAGCWEGTTGRRTIEEQWMRPRGGRLVGMARASIGDSVRSVEFTELLLRGDSLLYIAAPVGQRRTIFRGTMTGPRAFVVRNPAHDFPTEVGYALVTPDSLEAYIAGPGADGATRRVPYVYRRASCPTGR